MQIYNKKKIVNTIDKNLELSESDNESDDKSNEQTIRPYFKTFLWI